MRYSLFAIPLGFLAVFFFYPLFAVLRLSFEGGPAGLVGALAEPYYWRILGFTAWQALLSTLLTLALGLPGAYVFARYEFPGKELLRVVAAVPFVMPTVVVAAAFGALLGPRGLLNLGLQAVLDLPRPPLRLGGGLWMVLLAHVFYNYTVVLRLVGGFWAGLDRRLEEAAAMLGASRRQALLRVTLPLLLPAVGAAALLVFIFTFTSFGVIVILGGPRLATLEVEIYLQTAQLLRLDVAATLALIQALCTLLMSLAYTRLAARAAVPLELRPQGAGRRPRRSGQRLLVAANTLVIALLLGAPLAALALRSVLAPAGSAQPLTLAAYAALGENRTGSAFFVPPWVAVANSLRIAATTVAMALLVGVPAAYMLASPEMQAGPGQGRRAARGRPASRRSLLTALDALFMLPLGTSAVTLGLGYLVALSTPALGWARTSPWLIPLLHTLVALPFVIRALLPALRARSPRQREAAAMLGAPPLTAWLRVELPQIFPAIATGALFAFTVSLGEFGATLLVARPEAPTIPVMIFRFLGQPGAINYGQALALSTVLMLVTATSFLLLERVRPPGGEF